MFKQIGISALCCVTLVNAADKQVDTLTAAAANVCVMDVETEQTAAKTWAHGLDVSSSSSPRKKHLILYNSIKSQQTAQLAKAEEFGFKKESEANLYDGYPEGLWGNLFKIVSAYDREGTLSSFVIVSKKLEVTVCEAIYTHELTPMQKQTAFAALLGQIRSEFKPSNMSAFPLYEGEFIEQLKEEKFEHKGDMKKEHLAEASDPFWAHFKPDYRDKLLAMVHAKSFAHYVFSTKKE